ncbi:hypothetical protein FE257_003941 [Aspergillus nanangensis]|uniref:CTLH domain-containing protein n=1 Tax=Aspergillus nanangensis TaxID=2582783 RepID=A0AAD4GWA1_ASPNN|nr:hypothetical protein FE257_003941 [Aspergillus nanangensis]
MGPNTRTHWDVSFEWTDLHQSQEQLRPQMFTYDKLVDDCLERLEVLAPSKNYQHRSDAVPIEGAPKLPKRDIFSLVKHHAKDDPKIQQLWDEINTVPEWVDWDQIKRGQEVFFRYGMPILNVLSFESLLGGMGSPRIVETLSRTGGFSVEAVRKRLLETLQHVLQVSMSLESMKPGGVGHTSSVRVRLLHASVRSRIMSLVKEKPEYFNIEELGVPISDLDCVATINTFSTSVIWLGLPRQGIFLRNQEINDYLALWRLVAYYMGTPTDPFKDQAHGKAIMESLLASEIDPTDTGKILANNIVVGLEYSAPTYASKEFMEAMARLLNGDKLSDRLALARPGFYYQALVWGYCFIVMVTCYGLRMIPPLDAAFIELRRKLYYTIITDKEEGLGGESFFEFKYVPFYTRTTKAGKRRAHAKPPKPGIEALAQLGVLAGVASITALLAGAVADLPVFDLANNAPSYIPSAAPDHPNPPIPPEPSSSSYPSLTAAETIASSSRPDYRHHSTTGAAESVQPPPTRRRRRRRTSSPDLEGHLAEATGALSGAQSGNQVGFQERQTTHVRPEGNSPSPKRRRLANMRPDGISSANIPSQASNGSVASPSQKSGFPYSQNGQTSYASNNVLSTGGLHANGSQKPRPSYFGHDREEVTRILIQSLYELGYNGAASLLSRESGYQLESPAVATFRGAVLEGRWAEAERILMQSFYPDGGIRSLSVDVETPTKERLVLVEDAELNEMLFYLRQQKFLELLEARDLGAALMVLRHELTPLNYDIGRLHALSSLLMCPPEHLHDQAGWDGSITSSRERLLSDLSRSISPSVMIPDNRLAILLDNVKQNQINRCLYHNTANAPSLYSDHKCDRDDFPLRTGIELSQHSDEVWYCQFSHDGTKLVTAGRDHTVNIYDTRTFAVIHKLTEHEDGVAHASWSPDDSKLITCSQDKKALTAAAWAADGESFVTASLDLSSQLCHWSMRGQPLYKWPGGFRVQDCAITPDGQRLIAADVEEKIHVYNFMTHEEEYCLPLKSKPTSVAVSNDSRHMLVNLSEGQIQLIEIDTTDVIRRFQGQKQGSFVIRSTFGGAAENFVVSGSEDSRVYVWHKENGTLVEMLEGHISGCVNAISWNPRNPGMFASAGDDCLVRIWTRDRNNHQSAAADKHRALPTSGFARTSALRSTSSF